MSAASGASASSSATPSRRQSSSRGCGSWRNRPSSSSPFSESLSSVETAVSALSIHGHTAPDVQRNNPANARDEKSALCHLSDTYHNETGAHNRKVSQRPHFERRLVQLGSENVSLEGHDVRMESQDLRLQHPSGGWPRPAASSRQWRPVKNNLSAVPHAIQSPSVQKEQDACNHTRGCRKRGARQRDPRAKRVPIHHMMDIGKVSSNSSHKSAKDRTNIPLLVQELEEKLSKGQIECMICFEMVKRDAAIWSCRGCYAIFHITCIRKWARAPNSADLSLSASDASGNWRCPGCQSPQFVSMDTLRYTCFCGQVVEPQVDYYITPHSCGGPCKRPLGSGKGSCCEHVCTMQCHPGPCPPCSAIASPPQFCHCGKTSYMQRCSEQRFSRSCCQPCGHKLSCLRHNCTMMCHGGSCQSCDAVLTVKCFCGKKVTALACGSLELQGELDWENGVFCCEQLCSKKLPCGRHMCEKACHPGQCGDCDLAPEKVLLCPCGKVPVQELLGAGNSRRWCTDPVPCCGQRCDKLLPCGKHFCQKICHTGDCPPCEVMVDQRCRCKSSFQTMPCFKAIAIQRDLNMMKYENDAGLFLCNRKCGGMKSCGRHRCTNKCCPLADNSCTLSVGVEDLHLCVLPCGKKLRCGQHFCKEMCHNGYCPPCLESTFTEVLCACGKTSIAPPVPCGTPPPSCSHPCPLRQPCGHLTTHSCHFGECPPCIVPTAKECVGGHVTLRNVPCSSRDIKCNKLCGKIRQCSLHSCGRTCHVPPCDVDDGTFGSDERKSCGQGCGVPRRDCQHVCVAPCHPSAPCPETRCKFLVTISCSCGRLSQKVPCDAGEASTSSDTLELAYYANFPLQPVDSKARVPLGQRKLACDEECAKQERRRVLADAFGVNPASVSSESVQAASEAFRELMWKDPEWLLGVEDRCKYLVLGSKSPTVGPIRVHVFGCLLKEKRDVVRQIAEGWNLTVSTVGREPRRFLTVHVNAKSRAPSVRSLIGRSPLPVSGHAQAPMFSAALDMDPRIIVGLFDLPRDADISTLVLRFGGECELVWLNDKNALAVFSDMARAATALRRVNHACVYNGAVKTSLPAVGSAMHGWGMNDCCGSKGIPRRRNLQEGNWAEDAWGDELIRLQGMPVWKQEGAPIATSRNPWRALEQVEAQAASSPKQGVMPLQSLASASSNATFTQRTPVAAVMAADNWEDLDG